MKSIFIYDHHNVPNGVGVVKKSTNPKFKKMFISDNGTVYFNTFNDKHVKNRLFEIPL